MSDARDGGALGATAAESAGDWVSGVQFDLDVLDKADPKTRDGAERRKGALARLTKSAQQQLAAQKARIEHAAQEATVRAVRAALAIEDEDDRRDAFLRAFGLTPAAAPPTAEPVLSKPSRAWPKTLVRVLQPSGVPLGGTLLEAGSILVVSGAGGAGKSALVRDVAVSAATAPNSRDTETMTHACGSCLEVRASPVLMLTWEDRVARTDWYASQLVRERWGSKGDEETRDAALARLDEKRLRVMDLAGLSLFGPPHGARSPRPERLEPAWTAVWDAVDAMRAGLVVIDPALEAFIGESNAPGPVREFLGALGAEAKCREIGIVLVTHSNKDSRRAGGDVFDPGLVGGSGHWHDAVRAVAALDWDRRRLEKNDPLYKARDKLARATDPYVAPSLYVRPGRRVFGILKANAGTARVALGVSPVIFEDRARNDEHQRGGSMLGVTPEQHGGQWRWLHEQEWHEHRDQLAAAGGDAPPADAPAVEPERPAREVAPGDVMCPWSNRPIGEPPDDVLAELEQADA